MKHSDSEKIRRVTNLFGLLINEMKAFNKADLSSLDNKERVIGNLLRQQVVIIERDITCAYERISILSSCLDEKSGGIRGGPCGSRESARPSHSSMRSAAPAADSPSPFRSRAIARAGCLNECSLNIVVRKRTHPLRSGGTFPGRKDGLAGKGGGQPQIITPKKFRPTYHFPEYRQRCAALYSLALRALVCICEKLSIII